MISARRLGLRIPPRSFISPAAARRPAAAPLRWGLERSPGAAVWPVCADALQHARRTEIEGTGAVAKATGDLGGVDDTRAWRERVGVMPVAIERLTAVGEPQLAAVQGVDDAVKRRSQ